MSCSYCVQNLCTNFLKGCRWLVARLNLWPCPTNPQLPVLALLKSVWEKSHMTQDKLILGKYAYIYKEQTIFSFVFRLNICFLTWLWSWIFALQFKTINYNYELYCTERHALSRDLAAFRHDKQYQFFIMFMVAESIVSIIFVYYCLKKKCDEKYHTDTQTHKLKTNWQHRGKIIEKKTNR